MTAEARTVWVAVVGARLGGEGNRGEGKGGESGDRAPCHCLDDAASTMQPRRCSLGDDEDREEVAPPRSLASWVTQRARGSNPGRPVMCLRRRQSRRLLCQRSASTVEGIVDPLAEQRQSSARSAHCAIDCMA